MLEINVTAHLVELDRPEPKQIRGMSFTGKYVEIPGGAPLPLYEPRPRTDGKPSINTPEGWNLMRHEYAEKTMRRRLHRQPTEDEIQLSMHLNAKVAKRIVREIEGRKAV